MLTWWFSIKLWKRVLGGLALGILVGAIFREDATGFKWIGDLFINSIRMLVVPLIFTTLVTGVTAMGDVAKLGVLTPQPTDGVRSDTVGERNAKFG